MKRFRHTRLATVAAAVALIAGCSDDTAAPSESTAPAAVPQESVRQGSAAQGSGSDQRVELAAWQTIEITDVGGVTFTLADYGGQPVLIETFATWCVNCRAQLADTQEAAARLGSEAAVVALSVETELSPADVADYAGDNGFTDIRFAVMSPELLVAFADAFGTTVANPPSTPKVIVDAAGRAGELSTGPASTDDLVADVRAAAA